MRNTESEKGVSSKRSSYWDSWKGCSIVAVVVIHALGDSSNLVLNSFEWCVGSILRQISNFAVPIFLAVAGFFAGSSAADGIFKYYADRFLRLIPPYLFWTFVFIAFKKPGNFLIPEALFEDIFFGKGIYVGYFVIVMMQFILLTPFILKIRKDFLHVVWMVGISTVSLLFLYALRISDPDNKFLLFPMYALPFVFWYPFYHLGVFVAKKKKENSHWLVRHRGLFLVFTFIFAALSIVEGFYQSSQGRVGLGASQIKITSFLFSAALFLHVVARAENSDSSSRPSAISWLGRHSYPIYLSHLFFCRD